MTSLLLPFASRDSRRVNIFCWVQRRWAHLFPEWQLCLGEDDEENFNRSRARNEAFNRSTDDILVLSDADTVCGKQQVLDAIERVKNGVPWVIAHTEYHSLTEEYTDRLLKQRPDVDLVPPFESHWVMRRHSQAGVLVIPREGWERVGGYDERFRDWGYEDAAFAETMNHKWGQSQRTQGPMLHLWHQRGLDFDQPFIDYNRKLYEEARDAL